MPLKKQDTNPKKQTLRPAGDKEDNNIKTNYGENDELELDTAKETTHKKEYKKGGMIDTSRYTVDKDRP